MEILDKKTVVLIEDNTMLADIIAQKLRKLGSEVYTFANGLEGVAGIRHHRPDIVLLDIMLPIMNGYEVLQVMQEERLTEQSPVLVISNSGQPVELSRVLELGAKDYLVKADFTPQEVLDKARVIITNHRQDGKSDGANAATGAADDKKALEVNPAIGGLEQAKESSDDPIRVVVVEDDPMLRNMLAMKFSKQQGLLYMFVSEGDQAIDSIKSFEPDVVVLDLMLPGMDGFEIFEAMKAEESTAALPVIIFSNKNDQSDRDRATELGAAKYLVKAMTDLNELMQLIVSLAKR